MEERKPEWYNELQRGPFRGSPVTPELTDKVMSQVDHRGMRAAKARTRRRRTAGLTGAAAVLAVTAAMLVPVHEQTLWERLRTEAFPGTFLAGETTDPAVTPVATSSAAPGVTGPDVQATDPAIGTSAPIPSPGGKSKQSAGTWAKAGKGNLKAETLDGKTYLYSTMATYVGLLGKSGKDFALTNAALYEVDGDEYDPVPFQVDTREFKVDQSGTKLKNTYTFLKSERYLFDATGLTTRMRDDRETLLVSEADSRYGAFVEASGSPADVMDWSRMGDQSLAELEKRSKAAHIPIVWAETPMLTEEGMAVFLSNRDSLQSDGALDLYSINLAGGKPPKLILRAKEYGGQLMPLGFRGERSSAKLELVVYAEGVGELLLIDPSAASVKRNIPFSGYPERLSPDGRYLIYRGTEGAQVLEPLHLLDLDSGSTRETGMPEGYFVNKPGVWSPDGKHFAFFLEGKEGNDPKKNYRMNVKIGVVNAETGKITAYDKPAGSATIYPLGALSWVSPDRIAAYLDDDTTWVLKVEP